MENNPFDKFDSANPFDQFDDHEDSFSSKAGKVLDKAFHTVGAAFGPINEAASNFVTGLPAGLGGGITYLGGLMTGDPDAALAVKQGTEKAINDKIQYDSQSKYGKQATEGLNKGIQKIVESGGPTFDTLANSIPFVGKDLGSNHLANEAIGKAGTEIALNLLPIERLGGAFKGKGELNTKAADKIEATIKKDEPAPKAEANPFDQFDSGTVAHADDFAAVNPYDVGGHVTEAQAGRPATIDNAQGDLFGSKILEDAQEAPTGTPVTDELARRDQVDRGIANWEPEKSYDTIPNSGIMQDAFDRANRTKAFDDMDAHKQAQIDAAYEMQELAKQKDFNKMEAQRELDFAESVGRIENSPTRSFFLDPRNMDKVDFHSEHDFANEFVGDKSLMAPEHSASMAEHLVSGDVNAALDTIVHNHENVAYRNLADYLKGKLEGLNIRVHDEGILDIGDRQATGYYDPTTRTVGFSKVGAVSPHTVLHELVHAISSDFINSRPNDLRVMGIKDLFHKLSDMGMQKEFPSIVNPKEFLAEAFSSPEFQQYLKEHKLENQNRSTWRRFVDNVKSILGMSGSTRTPISDALEHTLDLGKQIAEAGKDTTKSTLEDAGMPSKLSDLMVTRKKKPEPVNTKNFEDVQRLKVPGLEGPISDFTFYDKPMDEIIGMAKQADDIPNTMLERLSHQLQAGGLFESLKTRNPVVKYTYERMTRATQEFSRNVKDYLTNPETGLVPRMREITPEEKGEIWAVQMLHEGHKELSGQELREAGMNEKQVAYYLKQREIDNRFFKDFNDTRAQLGMKPIDKRTAHIAGRFMGDFSRFVFDADGKIVGRIAGSTRWELDKISKFMAEKHPEWQMGKREYNTLGRGKRPADRFGGLMEAINFIERTDASAAKLFETYRDYMQSDAINYLNATRHAKAKVKDAGGIVGSQGNKPWETAMKNAEEGMKAQIAYYEQGYSWMAMEKAVHDLKPLLGDEEVVKQTPNATEWAKQYVDHALGRNQGVLADAANWTVSKLGEFSGIGHSNMFKASNLVKHFAMQKFMGLLNIPFSITQLMQPLQVHPGMIALLKNRGLEFSATTAQVKAANTYLHGLTDEKMTKLSGFEKQALDYAAKNGIMDVKMADHTKDINQSPIMENYHKIADLNITIPEHLTRGISFLFYSHLLKDAGIPTKDIFGAAENMTNFTMVNYHPIERPMGYAKLGWLGDIASTLTRYKHNQASQMAFYTREGIRADNGIKSYTPMAAFLATSLAFGGIMGFFGYNEADTAYQLVTNMLGKPDTLTNELFSHNTPELLTHGIFSTLGLDMTSRFSNANLIPDNMGQALIPYGSAVLDMAQATGRFVVQPNMTTGKMLGKSIAPQSIQGFLENQMFTEKQPDGRNLYQNNTAGPNFGKGRVYRSDGEMAMRNFGFRSIGESKELAKNYSDSQIQKGNADVVDRILTRAKYDSMSGNLTTAKIQGYIQQAAQLGESPDSFVSKFSTWMRDQHLSQDEQQRLQNATSGFKGAVNIREGR
jgi:hypothetical protein